MNTKVGMPGRLKPLVTGEIYHVFNLGIDHRSTFTGKRELDRAVETLRYYRCAEPPIKFSHFLMLDQDTKHRILLDLPKRKQLVKCLCYCFMPNHFHFLLEQVVDNGISKFMSNFQNSYTRYYNVKNSRVGPLFLDQFKAVRIETEEQFIHVSRYIHLNPFTGFVVKTLEELIDYPWSSFDEYVSENHINQVSQPEQILSYFKNRDSYKQFVFDQAQYQRELKKIQHLTFD